MILAQFRLKYREPAHHYYPIEVYEAVHEDEPSLVYQCAELHLPRGLRQQGPPRSECPLDDPEGSRRPELRSER